MEAFTKLGDDVLQRWSAMRFDRAAFPAIAAAALADHALHSRFTHEDIIQDVMADPRWPVQFGSSFGQPPLNLYVGPGFYIEVLTWMDATTDIHQHNFSGAFQVFAGSSLHSRYDFDLVERIDPHIVRGAVRFGGAELLKQGDIREIHSGAMLIHSLFHLHHPSVSVVVRTDDDASGPQFSYMKPWFGIDPFHKPEPFATQTRLLFMLAEQKHPRLPEFARTVLASGHPWLTLRTLETVATVLDAATLADLADTAARRTGAWVRDTLPCLTELRREANIAARRAQITDVDHRYLMALLLNLPHRDAILAMMDARNPGQDPVAHIVRTIGALAAEQRVDLQLDAVSLAVLDGLLRGHGLDQIVGDLSRRYGAREVAASRPALEALCDEFHRSILLGPLFTGVGAARDRVG